MFDWPMENGSAGAAAAAASGGRRAVASALMVCPASVYYNEALQRSAAWLFLRRGFKAAKQEALDLAAAWLGAVIQLTGRRARALAALRGTAAANYCDVKQALRETNPGAFALLFAAGLDPQAEPLPAPARSSDEADGDAEEAEGEAAAEALADSERLLLDGDSWDVAELREAEEGRPSLQSGAHSPVSVGVGVDGQRAEDAASRLGVGAGPGGVSARPPHVPNYLPVFPLPALYRQTPTPWPLDDEAQLAASEGKRKRLKMELQLQLPQLQLADATGSAEFGEGPFESGSQRGAEEESSSTGLWGVCAGEALVAVPPSAEQGGAAKNDATAEAAPASQEEAAAAFSRQRPGGADPSGSAAAAEFSASAAGVSSSENLFLAAPTLQSGGAQ